MNFVRRHDCTRWASQVQTRILQTASSANVFQQQSRQQEKKEQENTHTNLFREELAVVPGAKEENVATIVHSIPDSNHTIYLQWPLEFFYVQFCDFDGEDLHGPREISK